MFFEKDTFAISELSISSPGGGFIDLKPYHVIYFNLTESVDHRFLSGTMLMKIGYGIEETLPLVGGETVRIVIKSKYDQVKNPDKEKTFTFLVSSVEDGTIGGLNNQAIGTMIIYLHSPQSFIAERDSTSKWYNGAISDTMKDITNNILHSNIDYVEPTVGNYEYVSPRTQVPFITLDHLSEVARSATGDAGYVYFQKAETNGNFTFCSHSYLYSKEPTPIYMMYGNNLSPYHVMAVKRDNIFDGKTAIRLDTVGVNTIGYDPLTRSIISIKMKYSEAIKHVKLPGRYGLMRESDCNDNSPAFMSFSNPAMYKDATISHVRNAGVGAFSFQATMNMSTMFSPGDIVDLRLQTMVLADEYEHAINSGIYMISKIETIYSDGAAAVNLTLTRDAFNRVKKSGLINAPNPS